MIPLNVPVLLKQFHLRPKKSLGQNFLVDETALATVTATADLRSSDTVLEIGPGLGGLTRHLAAAAQRVVAVELDESLLPALEHVLQPHANIQIFQGDILTLDPASFRLPPSYKVVANVPYYITSAVIRHLLEAEAQPSLIVLTVQREVAERICAKPGDMSLLAVSVQFYARPDIAARIPAGAFYPVPAVDSAVVRLDVLPQPAVPVADEAHFFRVVKAGFSQKRKQLRNALSGGLRLDASLVDGHLTQASIDPKRRAETLTLEEWGRVCEVMA